MKLRTKSKNEPILKLLKFQHVGEFVKNEPILKLLMWVNLFVLPAPSPIKKTRFQKCAWGTRARHYARLRAYGDVEPHWYMAAFLWPVTDAASKPLHFWCNL